jgi:parvulin-like peptidyl-prolyl isomerase
MNDSTAHRFVTGLLFLGILLIVAWVLTALVRPPAQYAAFTPDEETRDIVAVVNGTPIDRLSYDRALAALTLQERGPDMTEARRRQVLQALIDEELLLQQAARMEIHFGDPLIRRQLVNAMLDAFAARVDPAKLSEPALRTYHKRHAALFAEADRVAVDALYFRDEDRARAGAEALRQKDGKRRAGELAEPTVFPVPEGLLPRQTLENYLGPTASRTARQMRVGEVSEPVRTTGGYWVLRVTDRETGRARPFEEVRDAVASLVRRKETDRMLQAWLKDARAQAVIHVADQATDPLRPLAGQAVGEVLRARMGEGIPNPVTSAQP